MREVGGGISQWVDGRLAMLTPDPKGRHSECEESDDHRAESGSGITLPRAHLNSCPGYTTECAAADPPPHTVAPPPPPPSSQVMFDFKPDFDPPFVDGSVFRLYDYFDENPELGDLPAEVSGLRVSVGPG